MSAWNAVATSWVGVQAGGMVGVVALNDGANTNEASKTDEEASCGATTGATEWGGTGATVAYHTTAAGQEAAQEGCLTGW